MITWTAVPEESPAAEEHMYTPVSDDLASSTVNVDVAMTSFEGDIELVKLKRKRSYQLCT